MRTLANAAHHPLSPCPPEPSCTAHHGQMKIRAQEGCRHEARLTRKRLGDVAKQRPFWEYRFNLGETDMGDKGKRDKGKKEQQKKAHLSPKDKRKKKKEQKSK